MSYELIAYGDANDLSSLPNYQNSFGEGDGGYLDLQLASPSPSLVTYAINELNSRLLNQIEGYHVEVSQSLIRVHFKVAIPPLAIIALAVAAVIVLLGLILSWKLYKLTPAGVVGSITALVLVCVFAAVAAIALIMALRKAFT